MTNEPGFVGLAEVIGRIRGELEEARAEAAGHDLGFAVENVSLTFTVQVHRAGSGRGGVRIGVVTAELGGSVDHQTTHQVQVDLKPELTDGKRVKVNRR
ncbi:trypco2 family protein [Streptomyces sp. NPDC059402]|uniref:trypco2 family protein n=1 Tax=unclassified Streptomyces TaxID=2593676 RepID=UPI0036866D4C